VWKRRIVQLTAPRFLLHAPLPAAARLFSATPLKTAAAHTTPAAHCNQCPPLPMFHARNWRKAAADGNEQPPPLLT